MIDFTSMIELYYMGQLNFKKEGWSAVNLT